MLTPDTTRVAASTARVRFMDRLDAIADGFQDWLTNTPVLNENAADRDVARNARDLAEALQELLEWLPSTGELEPVRVKTITADSLHTVALLETLAAGYGISVPGTQVTA